MWGFTVRGSWRPNISEIFWPQSYGRQRCVFLVLWCSTRGPEATLLGDGFLYGILSASSPDLNSSGPKGPFGLMWLSLTHLVYNSVRSSTQLPLECVTSFRCITLEWHFWPGQKVKIQHMSGSSNLDKFSWWEAGGRIVGALWGVAARTCSILLATFLCNCRLASSPAV